MKEVSMIYKYLRKAARRLLDRKAPTISTKNAISITRISASGEPVIFVSSYPRSGNTWMRHLLADCFIQNMGINSTTELPIHPDKIIPDRYCNLIAERDTSIITPGLFVKTHDSFERALKILPSTSHKKIRHIYIYRKPEDALVSYYHFHRRYQHLVPKTNGGIDAFCLARVDDWKSNVESYIKAKDTYSDGIFFVSYERMLSDSETILMSIFSWLNVPVEVAVLQRAISNTSFEKLRAKEEKNPINKEEYFFRRGAAGGGREELLKSTLDVISTKTSEVLRKADAISAAAEQVAALDEDGAQRNSRH